jgi:hypothetical protein
MSPIVTVVFPLLRGLLLDDFRNICAADNHAPLGNGMRQAAGHFAEKSRRNCAADRRSLLLADELLTSVVIGDRTHAPSKAPAPVLGGVDHMLAGVQHQQRPLAGERLRDSLG